MLSITWAGHTFDLHAERAVFWRRGKALLIADPHFGKAAAFRHHGVPVPSGTTQTDVDRLSGLLHRTGAQRLIILGDFLHSAAGRADCAMSILQNWRERHSNLDVLLVRGNHDRHAGDPPPEWNFRCVDEPHVEGEFAFCHAPGACRKPAAAGGFAPQTTIKSERLRFHFAGHVHPCAVLHDVDGSRHRAACFLFTPREAILPAFGGFTGLHPVRPRAGDRVFAIGEQTVTEVRAVPARA